MTSARRRPQATLALERVAAAPDERPVSFGARLLYSAPELVPVAVAGFSVPAMILLLAGRFYIPWVIGLGLVCAAAALVICRVEAPAQGDRQWLLWTALAGVAVIAWFLLNAHWSGQDLYATRDQSTYNLAGRWLVDHRAMPISMQLQVFGDPPNAGDGSAGFPPDGHDLVYAQGNHLLPVLLAVSGWLAGPAVLLKTNALIGAFALFAFFGIARRIVGSFFAFVGMLGLAVSMPMLYVSRDTLTEPLALLFLAGGLSLAWRALHTGRVRDFALAGLVMGASAMTRVDSYASLLSLIVVAAVVLVVAPAGQRQLGAARAAALLVAAAVPAYLGYRDLRDLAPKYFHDLSSQITMLRNAALVLIAAGVLTVLAAWCVPGARRLVGGDRRRQLLAHAAAAATVAGFVFLALRPLWLVKHGTTPNALVAALQKAGGHTVDATRTYAEQTLSWQAWYLGWPTVVLAVGGYALLVHRLVRRGDLRLLPVVAMCLSLTALYLWTPQITPDQAWASRRYLPVVIPGLLLAAVYAVRWLAARAARAHAALAPGTRLAGALVIVLVPAAITWPTEHIQADVGQLALVQSICRAVGQHGAVVAVDRGTSASYQQTIRAYCDVPSVGVVGATAGELATMRAAAASHGRVLYALTQHPATAHFAGSPQPAPFRSFTAQKWPQTIEHIPQRTSRYDFRFWLGRVNGDGSLQPLAASPAAGSSP